MKVKLGSIVILIVAALTITVCENEVDSPFLGIEKIQLNTAVLTITKGATGELSVAFVPSNVMDKAIKWSSDDTGIATVTAGGEGKGIVKAKNRGTTTIWAKTHDGGKTAGATVMVEGGVDLTNVTLSSSALTISVGSTEDLTATLTPAEATYRDVRWESSDPSTVELSVPEDGDGLSVTLHALKEGEVNVSVIAEDGDITKTCVVTSSVVTSL
jgi:uncharacterized protein YjdB